MKTFYDREEYSFEDIQSLIQNEVEESIYLDFKEAGALEKNDSKRKDISKDIASFANSDGGIIIYGIKEENHKASSFSFIDGDEYTKEWLEQVINSTIQRHIPDLKIFPIRQNREIKKTIYVVKIPKSIEAPHLSKDKRFYKRFNFESVMMDEYEIRQLYGRKIKSKLLIASWHAQKLKPENDTHTKINCEVQIVNDGDITESLYKVNIYFNGYNKFIKITWDKISHNYDYTWMDSTRVKISAVGRTPIFPNEQVNALRIGIEVPNENLVEALKDIKIEVRLLYSNGEDEYESTFTELMDDIMLKSNN